MQTGFITVNYYYYFTLIYCLEIGNTKGEAIFNAGVNWSRDIFSERENTNKLVLQNHAGVLLSKKVLPALF